MSNIIDQLRVSESKLDIEKIERAYYFAEKAHSGQMRKSGEPYFLHPCEVATTLYDWGLDTDTIVAGLLHDVVEDTECTYEDIEREFGETVAQLVDGVTKISKLYFHDRQERLAESLRKMLLAMAKDVRVILVKLADRLHNMRTLKYRSPASREKVARETLDIYAPLANRLGMHSLKAELEDLCLFYLNPEAYQEVKEKVAMQRQTREAAINRIKETLAHELEKNHIKYVMEGRPKHFYSIYRKMTEQGKSFDQIFDLMAVRVIVEDLPACYAVLGIVHTIWTPVPDRIKDYIAMPKPNFYQSLHTTLMGEQAMPFEVQIRTFEMHRTAEYGIAAHWKYKEQLQNEVNTELDSKLAWLRQMIDWQQEMRDPNEFMEMVRMNLYSDEVFVFTPKSDVVNLQKGSTPLDFAYRIHSAIGNSCIGAKINGRIVPLDTQLKNGDVVDIITSSASKGPSRDWLNIVKTPNARGKIRAFFKKEGREENIAKGRDMLEGMIKREGYQPAKIMTGEVLEAALARMSFTTEEDMLSAIGYGGITTRQVFSRLQEEYKRLTKPKEPVLPTPEEVHEVHRESTANGSHGIIVKGERDMLVRFARCCNPLPQDKIIGFITRGRGVSVHRADCPNIANMMQDESRMIEVAWEDNIKANYVAELTVNANDRSGMIVDITNVISSLGLRLVGINARVSKASTAGIKLMVEIHDKTQLDNLIKKLHATPGIYEVFRMNSRG